MFPTVILVSPRVSSVTAEQTKDFYILQQKHGRSANYYGTNQEWNSRLSNLVLDKTSSAIFAHMDTRRSYQSPVSKASPIQHKQNQPVNCP